MYKATFAISKAQTQFGQNLFVVGSSAQLGAWKVINTSLTFKG
jgi:hypothetical protein